MTTIDRDELRKLADRATPGPWAVDGPAQPGPDDSLVAYPVEDGGAVAYVQPAWDDAEFIAAARTAVPALMDALTRAEAQAETRRQQTAYWQERAEGFEARIADVLALCDEWAAMGTRSMNIGAVRRALGGVAGESTALARAEARIQAVEAEIERHEKHLGPDPLIPAERIRRALDAP